MQSEWEMMLARIEALEAVIETIPCRRARKGASQATAWVGWTGTLYRVIWPSESRPQTRSGLSISTVVIPPTD